MAGLLLAERADTARVHAVLGPAIDRFAALDDGTGGTDDEQARFRAGLDRFVRTYAFLAQIVSFTDTELERDYLFGRALQPFIKADAGTAVDLGGVVELTHLRQEQRFAGSVSLRDDEGEVRTIYSGGGLQHEPDAEPLSSIIERLNDRYGIGLTDTDRLFPDAVAADMVDDEQVQLTATNTSAENFALIFPKLFQQAMLGRENRNEKVVYSYIDSPAGR